MSMLNSKTNSFRVVEKDDLDYVTGGASITDNVDPSCRKKNRTDRCDCKQFKPSNSGVNLNICDFCDHARAKNADSETVYCPMNKI